MYEKLTCCPVCLSKNITNHIICQDHLVSKESFAITRCDQCSFLFTNPRPNKKHIAKYYQSSDYQPHKSRTNTPLEWVYAYLRNKGFRRKRNIIANNGHNTGTLIDIGTGTGEFLNYMHKKGWTTYGVESDPATLDYARSQSHSELTDNLFNIKPKKQFDVITLWHVLEHLHDLEDTLSWIKKAKAKKGRIYLALPNHLSLDADHYQELWAAYDVPRHLYHFNPETLKIILKRFKLKIIEQHPLYYDAYYVSMLSERYRTGNDQLFKAYSLGRKSNQHAAKTGQYSSLIYTIK
jgi:2-polyprenyl-3-methyl-5-hydroxy-6-metoxy-1,4-benzoquinol methylase